MGLLTWLRGDKRADDELTEKNPAVKLPGQGPSAASLSSGAGPAPGDKAVGFARIPQSNGQAAQALTEPQRALERDADKRHVDKGEIARGGMGSIRKVLDTNLSRTVAMKVLFPELKKDARWLQRFAEEAQIMGQLEHPNIVPVHDYGEDTEGTRYFTMRYVRGQTLTELLAKPDHPAGSREFFFRFFTIFVKVLDAVAFAHSRGVIHRDLKPDNIMVGAFGEAYLMDWGIAKILGRAGGQQASPVDAARTLFMSALGTSQDDVQPVQVKRGEAIGDTDAQGQIIGTFFYMAPEQALAQIDRIDERTDIFLLGGVLYEILTGQPPYVGTNVIDVVRLAQAANIPPPDLVAPDMSPPAGLSAICMKCLARDQDDRYQSAIELKRDIETFLKGGASFPSITFAPGEHLMKEGDPGEAVYILQKGTVQVYQTDKAGRRRGLATLGPGAVVGEAAVFRKSSRTASVVAIDAVTATAVTAKQLEKELGLNSWLGALVKALAERFGTMNDRLTKGADEQNLLRVTNWVLQYLVLYGQPDASGEKRVPWSAVVEAAASSLMKSEAELLPLLEGAGFHVDRNENLLSFRPAR